MNRLKVAGGGLQHCGPAQHRPACCCRAKVEAVIEKVGTVAGGGRTLQARKHRLHSYFQQDLIQFHLRNLVIYWVSGLVRLDLCTMAFRGTDVKEPLCANLFFWHFDWAQFNWSQQTARQEVTWELGSLCLVNMPAEISCAKRILLQMVNSNIRDSWCMTKKFNPDLPHCAN